MRQHPLLLWLDATGFEGSLSLVAYYILIFACAWFVLWRGRQWWSHSTLIGGTSKADGSAVVVGDKPELSYIDSPRNQRLLERTRTLQRPYVPSFWLGHSLGGHMQSFMFATWCPPADRAMVSRLVTRQDQVESSFDGGVFRMDWFDLRGAPLPADAPVVFVLPGVVGQGTNVYIRHLAAHLSIKYGWRVVTKNWRGIGLGLSTRRPETWDDVALSDSRDAIMHVRKTVGMGVPVLGVGFSFGGCMLTAIAGSVQQEEHGLRGLVSISGLFDMSAMMRHIAEQYAYPYGFANTRVTVRNYRKFKVLETLTAETDASGVCGDGNGCSDDGRVGMGSSKPPSPPLMSSASSSTGLMRRRKSLRPSRPPPPAANVMAAATAAAATAATAAASATVPVTGAAPWSGAAFMSSQAARAGSAGSRHGLGGGKPIAKNASETVAAAAAAGAAGAGMLTAKEMAAIKDPSAFHEAFTLPFTGDASTEAYFERIERIMSKNVSSVTVPTLCLLAKDDPLCPPLAWVRALEAAAKSEGIVVAVTEHGGHCGWFDGLGAGSWLDRAAGDFLASALELSNEVPPPSSAPSAPSPAKTPSSCTTAGAAPCLDTATG